MGFEDYYHLWFVCRRLKRSMCLCVCACFIGYVYSRNSSKAFSNLLHCPSELVSITRETVAFSNAHMKSCFPWRILDDAGYFFCLVLGSTRHMT